MLNLRHDDYLINPKGWWKRGFLFFEAISLLDAYDLNK